MTRIAAKLAPEMFRDLNPFEFAPHRGASEWSSFLSCQEIC
jgi:hypothetical protein